MKKGIFTVLFMVLMTVVFIAALAFIDEYTQERVAQNQEIRRIQSIMYACNILPEGIRETDLSPATTTADIPWNQRHLFDLVPAQPAGIERSYVFRYCSPGDPQRSSNRSLTEIRRDGIADNVSDPLHTNPLPRHRFSSSL